MSQTARPASNLPQIHTHTELGLILDNMERVVRGKRETLELMLITLLSGGHLLLEDVPGVGKTMMALALTRSLNAGFRRLQCTNDTLPADILGVSVYHQQRGEFEFIKGPIFCNIFLVDEINRASPRTQSALLQAMAEGRVSVENLNFTLPRPFMVIATQNPLDQHGTFPLPENQLDRFQICTAIGYPDASSEKDIYAENLDFDKLEQLNSAITLKEIETLQEKTRAVSLVPELYDYLLAIVERTRKNKHIDLGVSPRGGLALKLAAQARALLKGRDYVTPDDLKQMAVPVLAHRLGLGPKYYSVRHRTPVKEEILKEIIDQLPAPR